MQERSDTQRETTKERGSDMIKVFNRKGTGAEIALNPAFVEHAHDPGTGVILVMNSGNKFQVEGELDAVVKRLNDRTK